MTLSELLNTAFFHWSAEKAIWLGGHTLSWDARCAGIYVGFGIGVIYHLILDRKAKRLPPLPVILAACMLFVPLFIDVITLAAEIRSPSNDLRFLTGLLFGQAASVFICPAFITLTVTNNHERAAIASASGFSGLVILGGGAFLGKSLDNGFSYYVLELLGIIGNLGLLIVFTYGALSILLAGRMRRIA